MSEEIIKLLETAAAKSSSKRAKHFDTENIDGGVESVCVSCEEDYLIAMTYIGECYTFNRAIDLSLLSVERQREKILDLLLTLL